MIVSILAMVIHKVPSDDLVSQAGIISLTMADLSQRSPSGFGAFHLAVLSIAARFFDRDAWPENLLAAEDATKGR